MATIKTTFNMNSLNSNNKPLFTLPLSAGKLVLFIFCLALSLQLAFAVKACMP